MPSSLRPSVLSLAGLAVAALLATAAPLCAQDAAKPAPAAEAATPAPDTVIATVEGRKITEAELEAAAGELDPQFGKLPPEQRRAAALSALIEIEVLANKALADGLDKSAEFQRRLALLNQRALHAELVDKEVVATVTDADLKKRYDEEIAKMPASEEVHARHILVKTKEEAEAVIKELDGGAEFEKVAKEKSTDGAAAEGGDLGFFGPGQMVPEFEKAAFALQPGTYTKEPVQTQFGWHVVKVEEKRAKEPPALDQVKEQIRQALVRDRYFDVLGKARSAAKINIADPELKKAVDAMDKAQ